MFYNFMHDLMFPFLKWDNVAKKDVFSWQAALTAMTGVSFIVCKLGFAFNPNVRAIPDGYLAVDAGVFIFYFGKQVFDRLSIAKADETKSITVTETAQ